MIKTNGIKKFVLEKLLQTDQNDTSNIKNNVCILFV